MYNKSDSNFSALRFPQKKIRENVSLNKNKFLHSPRNI